MLGSLSEYAVLGVCQCFCSHVTFIECVASLSMVLAGNDPPCSRSGKRNLVISSMAPRLQLIPMLLHPKVTLHSDINYLH